MTQTWRFITQYLLIFGLGIFFINSAPSSWAAQIYKYKAYAVFPATDEDIYFDVVHNFTTGFARLAGRTSKGAVCQGIAWPTSAPTNANCIGQTAAGQICCTNGYQIVASYALGDCFQGSVVGFDRNNPGIVTFLTFGGAEQTLKQRAVALGKAFYASRKAQPTLKKTPSAKQPKAAPPAPGVDKEQLAKELARLKKEFEKDKAQLTKELARLKRAAEEQRAEDLRRMKVQAHTAESDYQTLHER